MKNNRRHVKFDIHYLVKHYKVKLLLLPWIAASIATIKQGT